MGGGIDVQDNGHGFAKSLAEGFDLRLDVPGVLQVARRYGVVYARRPADASGRYAVDHTADTFVVAPDGRLSARLAPETPPEALAAELRRWLREPPR